MLKNKAGMTASKRANAIIDVLLDFFEDRIDTVVIENLSDEPDMQFRISFVLYNYYEMRLEYDGNEFNCSIYTGGINIYLENSQKWRSDEDMVNICKDLEAQMRLRIPDKFLIANGWQ